MLSIEQAVQSQIAGKGLASIEIGEVLNNALVDFQVDFQPKVARNLSLNWDEQEAGLNGGGTRDDGSIVVYYDPESFADTFDDERLTQSFFSAAKNVIEHELVHRGQQDRASAPIRGDDPDNVIKYLSNPKEIMAMARQAVNQYLDVGYSKAQVLQLLRAPWKKQDGVPGREESDVFWNYTEHFDGKDPVFKKMVRMMADYLNSDSPS